MTDALNAIIVIVTFAGVPVLAYNAGRFVDWLDNKIKGE